MIRRLAVTLSLIPAAAGIAAAQQDTSELADLRRQIALITREIEALKLGQDVVVGADTGVLGFGPAASKVYKVAQGVSIGGYGEVLYENFAASREDGQPSGKLDQLDALRAIVYVGYKFDDRLLFNSEIEIEHANEIGLEFAYLDYRLSDRLGFRAGLLLVPMGFLNELHEPPVFLGAKRTETEQRLMPTTWRENGLGVFGNVGPLAYRAYVVNGLNASGFTATGLRGGRQKGARALAADLAGVARLDFVGQPGLLVGGSAYLGNSGQGLASAFDPSGELDVRTFIWEAHADYRYRGAQVRGLVAMGHLTDVAELNTANGFAGAASVGENLFGWYVEGGYDVLRLTRTAHQLIPYVRYELLRTQDRVPDGFAANPATDQQIWTLGGAWKPIPNVALKAEYQILRNRADTGINPLNLNLSYLF
jgi:hypothetical protein